MAPLPFINYSNATKVSLLGISLTEDEDEFVFGGEKNIRENENKRIKVMPDI